MAGLKIGCLNIKGLLGKIVELSAILRTCQFDLMCRCETFLGNTVPEYWNCIYYLVCLLILKVPYAWRIKK